MTTSRILFFLILLAVTLVTASAEAALNVGDKAPDFTTEASLGGKEYTFSLSEALKSGPVVLYFYPAAFTPGCTREAHEFAEAMNAFTSQGATVVGISHDPIDTLKKFSVSECRSKFPVASDADGKIMKAYDAVLVPAPAIANRTSYLIVPDDMINYVYSDMDPEKHVSKMLTALRDWTITSIKPKN